MIPKNFKNNRELLVDNVIRLKLCASNINNIEGIKKEIYDFYKSENPSLKIFGEYLNKMFAPYGFYAVNLPIDDYILYKPFSLVFNNAGLHFFFRDENQIIYSENIKWREFANWIAKMF